MMNRTELRAALEAIDEKLVCLVDHLEALERRVAVLEARHGITSPADAESFPRWLQ
jgi:uncharacterized protein involved in exopolysaccharide biosynthesis